MFRPEFSYQRELSRKKGNTGEPVTIPESNESAIYIEDIKTISLNIKYKYTLTIALFCCFFKKIKMQSKMFVSRNNMLVTLL